MHEAVTTELAPTPFGAYSQAVIAGENVFVSGQVGIDPALRQLAGDTAEAQATQTILNIGTILKAAGLGLADIVVMRLYIQFPSDFPAVNDVLAAALSLPYPARTATFGGLPPGVLVEIDVHAIRPNPAAPRAEWPGMRP